MATASILFGLTTSDPLSDRVAWANSFATIVDELDSPRTDCPLTLPEVPEAPVSLRNAIRSKPLNDHLECQLLYYCEQMYAELHLANSCPGMSVGIKRNQGTASDWIEEHSARLLSGLKAAALLI